MHLFAHHAPQAEMQRKELPADPSTSVSSDCFGLSSGQRPAGTGTVQAVRRVGCLGSPAHAAQFWKEAPRQNAIP